jgi:hypothetical protein
VSGYDRHEHDIPKRWFRRRGTVVACRSCGELFVATCEGHIGAVWQSVECRQSEFAERQARICGRLSES